MRGKRRRERGEAHRKPRSKRTFANMPEPHRRADGRSGGTREAALEGRGRCRAAFEPEFCCGDTARQRDAVSLAREARDHRRLIAKPEQSGAGFRRLPALGHRADRFDRAALREGDAFAEGGIFYGQPRDQSFGIAACFGQKRFANRHAEIATLAFL